MSTLEGHQSRRSAPPTGLETIEKLLTLAQLPESCAAVLIDMAWKAKLHPELYGYTKTLGVIQSILQDASSKPWTLTESTGSDETLASAITVVLGGLNAATDDSTVEEAYRERVFRMVGTNPLLGFGAKEHGLNYMLWDDAPIGANEATRAKWLALKAHLLRAHMRVVAYESTRESSLLGGEPQEGFRQSLYDVCGRFARHFLKLQPEWLLALSLMPDLVCPLEYIHGLAKLRLLVEGRTPEDTHQTAKRLLPIRPNLVAVLTSIDGFLVWGNDPDKHKTKVSPRDPADDDDEEDDGGNEGGFSYRQHMATRWRTQKSRRAKLLNFDDNPDEELLSSGPAQSES